MNDKGFPANASLSLGTSSGGVKKASNFGLSRSPAILALQARSLLKRVRLRREKNRGFSDPVLLAESNSLHFRQQQSVPLDTLP